MGFAFTQRAPTGRLARYVESVWHARGKIPYARERIAPTGSTVAGIVLGPPIRQTPAGGPAFLAAERLPDRPARPADRQRAHRRDPLRRHRDDGGRLPGRLRRRPGAVARPGGRPARALAGRPVAAGGAAARRGRRGRCSTAPRTGPGRRPGRVRPRAGPVRRGRRGCSRTTPPGRSPTWPPRWACPTATWTASSPGWSGLSPRTLARVLRVRRLLESIDVTDGIAWTRLAADLGWYDQAHLVRDVTRHTGVPPTAYVAAQRAFLAPGRAGARVRPRRRRVKSVQDRRPRRRARWRRWCSAFRTTRRSAGRPTRSGGS